MTTQEILQIIRKSDWVERLDSKGLKIFVVGGAVRDIILEKQPKDIDLIVTGGIEIENLASILKYYGKVDLVGESFAVIKFKPEGMELDEPLDIAIPRADTKTSEGHKGFEIITKGITLEQDLKRRDFTINAIAMTLDGRFVDPLEGLTDLLSGLIQAANPKTFIDDPLRIVRAVQFASRFNFSIAHKTKEMMADNIELLKEISGERILEEFKKIITKKGSVKIAFKLLVEIGFFKTFGLKVNKHFSIIDSHYKTLGDLMHLLLFFENNKVATFKQVFKGDNDTEKEIKALDKMHEMERDKKGWEFVAHEMVKITPAAFDLGCVFADVKEILVKMKAGELPAKVTNLEISGDDLKEIGLEGKGIGDTLKLLFGMVVTGKLPNDHETLMVVAKRSTGWGVRRMQNDIKNLEEHIIVMKQKMNSIDIQIAALKEKKRQFTAGIPKVIKKIKDKNKWLEEYLLFEYKSAVKEEMEMADLMNDLINSYENRTVEEKHLSFSQFVKLLELRIEKDKSNEAKREAMKQIADYNEHHEPINVGDPVWIRTKINGKIEELTGYLTKLHKNGTVDVKSGTLNFKEIDVKTWKSGFRIRKRHIDDLSHIEIPEELKSINTKNLLRAFKAQAHTHYGSSDYYKRGIWINQKMYDTLCVKAELNTREDIPNKNVLKQANKNSTIENEKF